MSDFHYYQKGTIGVRTSNEYAQSEKVGTMYKAVSDSRHKIETFAYKSGIYMRDEHVRPATHEEAEAYDLGCRHIDDLHLYVNRERLISGIL